MSEHSAIGWTEATWNPVTGCSHVSPGCANCYAETLSLRMGWSAKPWTKRNALYNVIYHPERLRQPLAWRDPRLIFVNSMSDLFHPRIPDAVIDDIFAVMALARRHTFQILTKRPERMRDYFTTTGNGASREAHVASALYRFDRAAHVPGWPLPNVWLGVSAEDYRRMDERAPYLIDTPAAVRFLSLEPLLGPIRFPLPTRQSLFWESIHWGIVGGETGPQHRPMDVAWAEEIAAQFTAANVPLFVKQDSGPRPGKQGRLSDEMWTRKEYPR